MTSQAVLESRDLALELHHAFADLDRGWPGSRSAAHGVARRLGEVRARLTAWLDAKGEERARLAASWREVQGELASLDVEDSDRSRLVALRTRVQPTYEAIVEELAQERVSVPSLRPTNYARNVLHVASAASGVVAVETVPSWTWATGIALTFAALGWTLEITRRRSDAINRFCMQLFGRTAHPHEAHRVNSATWYVSALVVLSLTHALVPVLVGLLVLGIGDPAAAVVGRRFGRVPLVHGRTLEGTLAFATAGALAAFGFLRVVHPDVAVPAALASAVVGAAFGAIAELVSRRVDDNLSIPLAAALGAALGEAAIRLVF